MVLRIISVQKGSHVHTHTHTSAQGWMPVISLTSQHGPTALKRLTMAGLKTPLYPESILFFSDKWVMFLDKYLEFPISFPSSQYFKLGITTNTTATQIPLSYA
uniref:Uncharacterized protein n=1 Tax=Octopus bimaculoides TaxID=37653 RepID=A0A0L8HCZ2_OCTBM